MSLISEERNPETGDLFAQFRKPNGVVFKLVLTTNEDGIRLDHINEASKTQSYSRLYQNRRDAVVAFHQLKSVFA